MSATSRRKELARVQTLYARLLYCHRTVRAYRVAPDRVLARFRLAPEWRALLPDPTSANHAAEMHGRRVLAVQEIEAMFPNTLRRLTGQGAHTDAHWLDEYLSSDEFFEPCWSLPHPTGVGRAHEGLTRFFFWLRRRRRLHAPGTSIALRDALFLEMSNVLNDLGRGARTRWFRQMLSGSYWRRTPKRADIIYVRTPDGEVLETRGKAKLGRLRAMGLFDLDTLQP